MEPLKEIEPLEPLAPVSDRRHLYRVWIHPLSPKLRKERFYRRYKAILQKLKRKKSPKGHIDIYV